MSLYVVKHGSSDYRLHRSDGTEIDTFDSDPRDSETLIPDLVDSVAAAHVGASILGDQQARRDHAQVVNGDWNYRDLTLNGETVPW